MKNIVMGAYALALAVILSGCAGQLSTLTTVVGLTVPTSAALVAVNSFNASETVLEGYLELPLCGNAAIIACRTASNSTFVVQSLHNARPARDAVRALILPGSTSIPVASYNALTAAVTTIQAIEKTVSPSK